MFRFARSGSVLFQLLSWLFVASLFCDGANLDDLLGGRCVILDDFEIAAPGAGTLSELSVSGPGALHDPSGLTLVSPFSHSQAAKVLVVIDQDSPSLEAGGRKIVFRPISSLTDAPSAWRDELHSAGLLHIRFRSIQI